MSSELFSAMQYRYMTEPMLIGLWLIIFSDDVSTPFGYLEEGEFGNWALIVSSDALRQRSSMPSISINISLPVFSENSPTFKKWCRGQFQRSIDAGANAVLFPQTFCQKVSVLHLLPAL